MGGTSCTQLKPALTVDRDRFQCLKLQHVKTREKSLSITFDFNLCRYTEVPAALVADLLGPRAIAATGAGVDAAQTAAMAAAAVGAGVGAGAAGGLGAEEVGPPPLPAHAAAAQGDVGLMRELLRGGAVGARVPGSGETALHVASSSAAAAVLLAAGAAVSGRDAAGHTALAAAAADDNPRLVAALLDHGAPSTASPEPGTRRCRSWTR